MVEDTSSYRQLYLHRLKPGCDFGWHGATFARYHTTAVYSHGVFYGGYVARHIALAAPERVTDLILANTSARPSNAKTIERNRMVISITEQNGFLGLSRKVRQKALHPAKCDDENLLQEMQDMALRLGQTAFLNQLGLERPNGLLTLGEIKCPTLVIWSRQDKLRSLEEAQELAKGIPNAKLEIIEDCGHMTPMEAPEKLILLLGKLL